MSNDKMVINEACPGHKRYINAFIIKKFGTVLLEE